MTNIEIRVSGAAAVKGKQDGLLTAGMVGATVGFSFDGLWDGLSKTAVFKCGGMVRDVIGVEDTARIPAEVLCADTELYVGVEGRSGDGAVVIPTVWVRAAYVYPGANASGDSSTDPTLPVWAQMQAMIGDLEKLGTADKSSLVAAINEALRSGGGAVDEKTIARLVDEYLAAHPPEVTETDPTVSAWAKQPEKPKYTADEVGALSQGELQAGINLALEQAKTSGAFDGAPGKSAYAYAQDGGYTGTEEEFAQKLAAEVPAGGSWKKLRCITVPEDASVDTSGVEWTVTSENNVKKGSFNTDENENPFSVKELRVFMNVGATGGSQYLDIWDGADTALVVIGNVPTTLTRMYSEVVVLGTNAYGGTRIRNHNNAGTGSNEILLTRNDSPIMAIQFGLGLVGAHGMLPGSILEFWGR